MSAQVLALAERYVVLLQYLRAGFSCGLRVEDENLVVDEVEADVGLLTGVDEAGELRQVVNLRAVEFEHLPVSEACGAKVAVVRITGVVAEVGYTG